MEYAIKSESPLTSPESISETALVEIVNDHLKA